MPISEEEFETLQERDLAEMANDTLVFLEEIGKKLGFKTDRMYPCYVGELDLVWYLETRLPSLEFGKLPVVGFEVETSERSRKHIKGDLFNLQQLHPALGVLILLKEGFKDAKKFNGLLEAAKRYVEYARGRILLWTEEELEKLKTVV